MSYELAPRGSALFLWWCAAPLGPWGVAGCVSVASVVGVDFRAPCATHAGLIAKRHMAQQPATAQQWNSGHLKRRGSHRAVEVCFRISRTSPKLRNLFEAYARKLPDIPEDPD